MFKHFLAPLRQLLRCQPPGIDLIYWTIVYVLVQICIPAGEANRVLSSESLEIRIVILRPVVVQPRAVVLAVYVLKGVGGGSPVDGLGWPDGS